MKIGSMFGKEIVDPTGHDDQIWNEAAIELLNLLRLQVTRRGAGRWRAFEVDDNTRTLVCDRFRSACLPSSTVVPR